MTYRRTSWFWLPVLTAVAASSLAVHAQVAPRLDEALETALRDGRSSRVVVKARAGSLEVLTSQLALNELDMTAVHQPIDAVTVTLDPVELVTVCSSELVAGCSSDAEVAAPWYPPGAARQGSVDLAARGVPIARPGGDGVTVALIDSGLHPSVAFWGRILVFADFTQGASLRVGRPFDDYGHGTYVAGLIGGQQLSADAALQGVAPAVSFVALKVLDAEGRGRTSDVICAIEFAVANRDRYGIDVINLALGHRLLEPALDDPLVRAVEHAVSAGIVVITAEAGDAADEARWPSSPGQAPSAIRVSLGPGGRVPRASELAPASTLARHHADAVFEGPSGRRFLELSGPGTASALTSGRVALVMQRQPGLTPAEIKAAVQSLPQAATSVGGQR